MPGKREKVLDYETYFMLMALLVKERSKDPKTQVGAVIVKNNRLLSTGYNGTTKGLSDDEMPWNSLGETNGDLFQIKNSFVIHAEANALDLVRQDLTGASIYVTLFPCHECAKRICNAGISDVYYLEDYKHEDLMALSKKILTLGGVKIHKITPISKLMAGLTSVEESLKQSVEREKSLQKIRGK